MGAVSIRFESTLPRPPGELWDWSVSAQGVQAEMAPLLKIELPRGMRRVPLDRASLGRPLGNCRFLLFGLLPVDSSRLTFVEMEPGRRFVEQSPLLSMKAWRHERLVEAAGAGARVVDILDFTPRMPGPLVGWLVARLFAHRHAVLRREFGERRSVARAAGGHQGAERVDVQPGEGA